MAVSPHLRPLRKDDLPAALALWEKASGVEISEGDSPDELAGYLDRNPGSSFAAEFEGVLIGAVLAGHDGRRGYLYHLAVAPSFRGQGLGRRLIEASSTTLRKAGLRRLLILVAADNSEGQEFWRALGWEDMNFARPMGRDL